MRSNLLTICSKQSILVLRRVAILFFATIGLCQISYPQEAAKIPLNEEMETAIKDFMRAGDIPGLSLVLIRKDRQVTWSFGYRDVANKLPVTNQTLFQLGSCSKAFTALVIAALLQEKKIDLDDTVSTYLPWLRFTYEDSIVNVTLSQLLHHTSGIPWNTISEIPVATADNALEMTVKTLRNQELAHLPGTTYEYASINYDVLALVVEQVTKQSFESYLEENIVKRLGLNSTSVGRPRTPQEMSKGYKIGFFEAREYEAPEFRGNNAAGYVISNADDMARWLQLQMGRTDNEMYPLMKSTHQRDETVPLHDMSAYAQGWHVSLDGTGKIYHGGLNPNFTAYVGFLPGKQIGVAVLANANSNYTNYIGEYLLKKLSGGKMEMQRNPGDGNDAVYSLLSMGIALYIVMMLIFLLVVIVGIRQGKRAYESISLRKTGKYLMTIVVISPFFLGLYKMPEAIAGFNWYAIAVWMPVSFIALIAVIIGAVVTSCVVFLVASLFPEKNIYKRKLPLIVIMSVLSGLSNFIIIVLVTSSIWIDDISFLVFYYVLALGLYLGGRRFVQTNLIKLTRQLICDLEMTLISNIFSTSYQRFEAIERGRVFTSLNEDVNTIGQSTYLFTVLITSLITGVGAVVYLASVAFWATLITVALILLLATLYYFVSRSANQYFEKARDQQNIFMELVSGLVDGFKELSMHRKTKAEFREDIAASVNEYKAKMSVAEIKFVNAFLVGESLLLVLLAAVSFGIPKVFPGVEPYIVMSFVIVLLYLIGPINSILGSIPALMQLKIAWKRVNVFISEIPSNIMPIGTMKPRSAEIRRYKAVGIRFQYKNLPENTEHFMVGPIDLELEAGEILFVIGGNGSGKTTLAKLLTGLYKPDAGHLEIDGKIIDSSIIGEYFSAVFSPPHIFKTLYGLNMNEHSGEQFLKYLKLLDLEKKVEIRKNSFSTINLSGGQRKRLALLKCYLENSPIYLFDEWAADQDPGYRNFFYRSLLPEMRKMGKIVIAITHDDNYFDVADRILKMNRGQVEVYASQSIRESI